jgi:simple sugar transport system ATP-binding protein
MRAALKGQVLLMEQAMPAISAHWLAQGVARIPEDRHALGLVGDLTVWENAVSENLRSPAFSRGMWIRGKAARAHAQAIVEAFDVRGAGLHAPARALSGGNMQKLILGRALLRPPGAGGPASVPRLIVAHQPTWGLDIGAVAYVQSRLLDARDAGAAVILISDDLDEVLTLGDRIAVMQGGRMTAARPVQQWSRESIGLAMTSQEQAHAI